MTDLEDYWLRRISTFALIGTIFLLVVLRIAGVSEGFLIPFVIVGGLLTLLPAVLVLRSAKDLGESKNIEMKNHRNPSKSDHD